MSARFFALIQKEFLVLSKDWHGLMVLFLMPTAFILIMSMAMENTFGDNKSTAISYVVLNQSNDKLLPGLISKLKSIPGYHFVSTPVNSQISDINTAIVRGDYQLAVIIPVDFHQRLITTTQADQATVPSAVNLLLAPSVKTYTQQIFKASLAAILLQQKMDWLLNNNPDPNAPRAIPQSTLDQFDRINIAEEYIYSEANASNIIPNAVQQNVPAWLVFAMFFVVIPLSTVFLIEKQQGTLLRLRVMNISAIQILMGKFVPYFCVNQIQMIVMIGIGTTIVPLLGGQQLNTPHSITGLIIISSACSFAAIGFALLVATIVKTTMQATTIGGVVNILFGALGGIMVPKFIMPDTMQTLTNISPMSWGLEGFLDLFLRQESWQSVLPESLYLAIFGTLCLGAAIFRFNKTF